MSYEDFETDCEVSDGAVTTVREKPEYEIPDVGTYKAHCIGAELAERKGKGGAYVVVLLTWELEGADATYEFNGEKKQFTVRDSLSLSYGPKAKLHKSFVALTGETPESLVDEEEFQKGGKTMIRSVFQYECFIGMKADLAIIHNTDEKDPNKTYANIGSYMCKGPTQKANADLCFED